MNATMKNKKQLKYQRKFNIWGFCVWLYNSIPHFSSGSLSTTFEWISRKTAHDRKGKEAIRKRRPQCFTHKRLWNEFFHYDFLLQEAGNAWSGNWNRGGKRMLIVRLIYEERSFDLVGNYVLYNFFRFFNSYMVNFFVFSNFQLFSTFFNFFQLFLLVFSTFFNLFQPFSTFFNFVLKL